MGSLYCSWLGLLWKSAFLPILWGLRVGPQEEVCVQRYVWISPWHSHHHIHKIMEPSVVNIFKGDRAKYLADTYTKAVGAEWFSEFCVLVAQSCPALCNPTDCSPPGSSVRGIFQARILEWVAISSSRGSSWPRDRMQSPALQADSLPFEFYIRILSKLLLFSISRRFFISERSIQAFSLSQHARV